MLNSGIYIIVNLVNGKSYIGQSRNISSRQYSHFHALERNAHHNKYLQRAFNKYGSEVFVFKVLEYCAIDQLNVRERFWIDYYQTTDPSKGYNNESGGNADKVVSERVRDAKRGPNNPMYGKKASPETIEKQRKSSRGKNTKLNESDIYQIKEKLLLGESPKVLAKKYDLSTDAILKIKICKNWEYVHSDINDQLTSMHTQEIALRNNTINELDKLGLSRNEISKRVGCTPGTVARVLGRRSGYYRDSPQKTTLQQQVISDYLANIPRDIIKEKYGISDFMYVSLISNTYNNKRKDAISEAIRLREEGMMVKDIAVKLGYSRLTISKWTKHLVK